MSILISTLQNAQILDMLKGVAKTKVKSTTENLVGKEVMSMVTKEAITTNFKDCNIADVKTPTFGENAKYINLCSADFTSQGYLLKPGYYEISLKSFCLKAGTYGPSKGDGYLYAPLAGPKEEIIQALVDNWYKKQSSVEQQKVQSLIWAIIAKTDFKNLNPELQLVAAQLLTEQQLFKLSGMGIGLLPDSVMNNLKSNLPQPVQVVLDAENRIRGYFSSSSYSYGELEQLAMLTGVSPGQSSVARGTWGLHPKGFWISYLPEGYSQMKVRIFVPDSISSLYYIPSQDVAVPANTSSQRLMVSNVLNCSGNL